MEIEDSKSEGDLLSLQPIYSVEEGQYLIEKLYSLIVAQTVTNIRSELNLENLNAKVQQVNFRLLNS